MPAHIPGQTDTPPQLRTSTFAVYATFQEACDVVETLHDWDYEAHALSTEGAKFSCTATRKTIILPMVTFSSRNRINEFSIVRLLNNYAGFQYWDEDTDSAFFTTVDDAIFCTIYCRQGVPGLAQKVWPTLVLSSEFRNQDSNGQ